MTYVLLWRVYDNRIKYIIIIIIIIIIDQLSDLNIIRRILSGNNCISFYNPILAVNYTDGYYLHWMLSKISSSKKVTSSRIWFNNLWVVSPEFYLSDMW